MDFFMPPRGKVVAWPLPPFSRLASSHIECAHCQRETISFLSLLEMRATFNLFNRDRRRVMRVSRIDTLFGTDLFHFEVGALRDIGSLLFTLNLFKGKKRAPVTRRKPGMKKAALSTNRSWRRGMIRTVTGNEAGPFKYP